MMEEFAVIIIINRFIRIVDSINIWLASVVKWFSVILVGIGAYEVLARFVFNRPTEWGYEMFLMTGATIIILSWGFLHKRNQHVKVDVIYSILSERSRKLIDIFCAALMHIPLIGLLSYVSFQKMLRAWQIGEVSIETNWFPPLGPLKTIIFIGAFLFLLQTISNLIQDIDSLKDLLKQKQSSDGVGK